MSPAEATLAHEDPTALALDLRPCSATSDRASQLRRTVTQDDAAYAAVAELLDADLVTLDERLGRAGGPTCRVLVPPRP